MSINEALKRMKENPGLKMWQPHHYRDWEYNYYDEVSDKYLIETGEVWNIQLSRSCEELEGYEDYNEGKR
jgi:hypothetical protein